MSSEPPNTLQKHQILHFLFDNTTAMALLTKSPIGRYILASEALYREGLKDSVSITDKLTVPFTTRSF